MKILVLNAGSSSQKSCLYDIEGELPTHPLSPVWNAQIDWIPQEKAALVKVETRAEKREEKVSSSSREETLSHLLSLLYTGPTQVISDLDEIDAVGHRVVHGGGFFEYSVKITEAVKACIKQASSLAPNHNPANLEGIELMEQLLSATPQFAVFDTAFHSQMPEVAIAYPGPAAWRDQGIRRYGFHGISHQYCSQQAANILNQPLTHLRLIVCHLGNGGSLAAVKNGQSIDTTMGFTPLDGLMMGTRSGSVDPGILIYLMREGYTADEIDDVLNNKSGLKGISGVSHDMRAIEVAIAQGNHRAKLARDLYIHRLKSCFGSMLMSLGGVDAVVFTAGIGEHSPWVRAAACEGMAFLGLKIDPALNENSSVDRDIAAAGSAVRVLVIRTQEDWAIAQDCWQYLSRDGNRYP